MSLARAIETGDLAELPSRRDEDWRWTDLRGLIRTLPAPSAAVDGDTGVGPFDGLADRAVGVLNGRSASPDAIETGVLALRWISRGDGAHAGRKTISVPKGQTLTLLESYEGGGSDYLSDAELAITARGR